MKLELFGESYYKDGVLVGSFLFGREGLNTFKNKKIIVWGTGVAAGKISDLFLLNNIEVFAYCDNDNSMWGKVYRGKMVLSPEEAYDCDDLESQYFILTMGGKNLDAVMRQLLIRYGEHFSCFFECQIGDYFHDSKLLEVVMESINDVMNQNMCRKGLAWYECMRSNRIYDNVILIIMSTKFWDNFVWHLYNSRKKDVKMLDIGPGYGTFSLIYSQICSGEVNWLCYSNNERVEQDFISCNRDKYPVTKNYAEVQNPKFNLKEKYDLIVFCEVLEHFKYEPVSTCKKIADWLSDEGYLFVSTPTHADDRMCRIYSSYKQLPNYTQNLGDDMGISNYLDRSEEHSYIYSRKELDEIFEVCNLEIVEYKVIYNHHRYILRRKKK